MNIQKLKYALGQAMFMMGWIGTIAMFWELFAMNMNYQFGPYRFEAIGYPWGTERVAAITDFWNMPDWSQAAPNVYFLNYAEVLIGAIFMGVYGVFVSEKALPHLANDTSHNKVLEYLFLALTLLSLSLSLYAFVKVQVLQTVYLINNTLYVPHNVSNLAIGPTPNASAFFQFYNISPSVHRVAFQGGVGGLEPVFGHITWDHFLFAMMGLTFIFMIPWKYFSRVTVSIDFPVTINKDDIVLGPKDIYRRLVMDSRSLSGSNPELSIVIWTENNVNTIEKLVSAIDSLNLNKEYIVIDDASTDGTFSVLKNMTRKRNDIVVIERFSEEGISSALKAALPYCRGKYVVIISGDFRIPPDALKEMLNIMKTTDADLVIGTSSKILYNSLGTFLRKISKFLTRLFLPEVRGISCPLPTFFMFRKEIVNEKDISFDTPNAFLEIIVKSRPKIREYLFKFGEHENDNSKFSVRDVGRLISLLLRLSDYTLLKFVMVGLTGVFVNELFLYILYSLTRSLVVSSVIAIELSILSNFMLNDKWTFKSRRESGLFRRLFRYNGVAIAGLVVNVGTLIVLTHLGLHYLLANIIGIMFGFVVNYMGSELLVWHKINKPKINKKKDSVEIAK